MDSKKFLFVSATSNVGEGKTYATEAAKWDAEIAPYIVAGGKYEKTLIFREATHELTKGSVSYGLSVADAARITALETWKDQYDAAKQLLTDYKKASAYSAIAATDTIVEGIGKLEAGLNAVQDEIGTKAVAETSTGAGDGKSATGLYKEIEDTAAATVTKIVASADADFDTLKEVADWIKSDTTGAAAMQAAIATLNGDENIAGSVKKALKDAKDYTDAQIDALEGSAENVSETSVSNPVKVHVESADGEVDKVEVSVQTQALATATAEADGLATAKDAKDYADTKKAEAISTVVGTDSDEKTADTIKGVKALIEENEETVAESLTDINGRLETLEGDAATAGSVKKAVADAKSDLIGTDDDDEDSDTIKGAKAYADSLVSDKNVSAEGDKYVGASASDNKVTVVTNVKSITVTAGTVPAWNADGSVKTAAVAPTISGTANSLADGSDIAAAIKAYADAAIAQAKAELENEIEWIEL